MPVKRILLALLLFSGIASAQTTWYVRTDGGTRYSASNGVGQCDGKHDAAYSGTGTNQPCAFIDYRYLYLDPQQYNTASQSWVMAGGDTAIIRGQTVLQAAGSGNCASQGNFGWGYGCNIVSTPIPSGTPSQPTRILGENYANCSTTGLSYNAALSIYTQTYADSTKTAKLWGGGDAAYVFEVAGSHDVDIECIDMTDHAACGNQVGCGGMDSTNRGIDTGSAIPSTTGNITLKNLNIHGFSDSGIKGNVAGTINATNVRIAFNGSAGWDFDPGNGQWSSGQINMLHVELMAEGCNEEYPLVHAFPASVGGCATDTSGGYGDAIGTPPMYGLNFDIEQSDFIYSMQDAVDLGHLSGPPTPAARAANPTNVVFKRDWAYGNLGANFMKVGGVTNLTEISNIAVANCQRISTVTTIVGAQTGWNTGVTDTCRAGTAEGANSLSDSILVPNASLVNQDPGNAVISCTGVGCTQPTGINLTFMSVGGLITVDTADPAVWSRTIASVPSNTSFTVSSAFPSNPSSTYMGVGPQTSATNSVIEHNTIVGYPSFYDDQCQYGVPQNQAHPSDCIGYVKVFKNNVLIGATNTGYNSATVPAVWPEVAPSVGDEDYNVCYNVRGTPCIGGHDVTTNPLLITNIAYPITAETQLDNFNFTPTSSTPTGLPISGVTTDFLGNAFDATHPTMGAIQFGSSPTVVSIAISPSSATVAVGATTTLTCTATYSDSSTASCTTPTWTSATTSVATVNSSGVVTGVAAGTSLVHAVASGFTSGNSTITVPAPATGMGPSITFGSTYTVGQTQH